MAEKPPQSPQLAADSLAQSADMLRWRLMELTYRCPKGAYAPHCPFKILAGLTPVSRQVTLDALGDDRLFDLLDMALPCHCPVDPRLNTAVGLPDSQAYLSPN